MAVLMSLGGNPAGDGFLVAPLGTTYEGELALWTDAGNAAVTLRADPMHNTAHPLRNIYTFRGLDQSEHFLLNLNAARRAEDLLLPPRQEINTI
jgi:hypothetical protein